MNAQTPKPLCVGEWRVDPLLGSMSRDSQIVRLEARTMRLLLCLAARAGQVVSIDELLDQVWPGVVVTPDSVYQAVTALRRLLQDDARQPAYIATVPRQGYRMVASVSPCPEPAAAPAPADTAQTANPAQAGDGRSAAPRRRAAAALAAAALCLVLLGVAAFLVHDRRPHSPALPAAPQQPRRSVAVLPFLDLTSQTMNEEYFADGMTEEIIDRLSRIQGLQVPSPTASFYFKGRQVKVPDIARSLSVAYVLDGSIRRSARTLRVAARLIRADDGYVIWSRTYDRPLDNPLRVQDDIAGELARAVSESI
jgi:transcriptional activator of cad operon